jgi:ABC-type oligopeptide transport system ATPase subunit
MILKKKSKVKNKKEIKMLIINLWGAPGSGKSTTASGLFFLMKINKKKVELVTEFAKELVWEKRENMFGDQVSIFSEQNRRLCRLEDHNIDFAITDSPLPLPVFYQPQNYLPSFEQMVFEQFHRYNNLNYFLKRKHSLKL